jgi:hypothetical protein
MQWDRSKPVSTMPREVFVRGRVAMSPTVSPSHTTRSAETGGPRLTGARLWVARTVWLALFVATIAAVVATLPRYVETLSRACMDTCAFSPIQARMLRSTGIAMEAFARASAALAIVSVLIAAGIALVLFWRRSNEWMVLVVAYFLVIYPVTIVGNVSDSASSSSVSALELAVNLLILPSIVIFYAIFLLFPSGRFVPRWSWLALLAWTIWHLVILFQADSALILLVGYPVFYLTAVFCQVYRYRRVSTPVQRQQTKWVVVGFVTSLAANQVFWVIAPIDPLNESLFGPVAYLVYQLSLLLVPITFFIAVQRYRLYDIDRLINRALVYGSLTAVLALIYVGSIITAQAVVHSLTGQSDEPTLVLVASTLLIAALFQPLRRRIQGFIDRRFYRRKYDSTQTVAAFSATLRSEVDTAHLSEHLVAVVQETMQPAYVSLWLRPTQQATH